MRFHFLYVAYIISLSPYEKQIVFVPQADNMRYNKIVKLGISRNTLL